MTAPAERRMSRVDTAWLRMDNDVNLMMIVGVWLLTPALELGTLRARIEDKLLKYERFRHRAKHDAMGGTWEEDPHFDIARHVVPTRLVRRMRMLRLRRARGHARVTTYPRVTIMIPRQPGAGTAGVPAWTRPSHRSSLVVIPRRCTGGRSPHALLNRTRSLGTVA